MQIELEQKLYNLTSEDARQFLAWVNHFLNTEHAARKRRKKISCIQRQIESEVDYEHIGNQQRGDC